MVKVHMKKYSMSLLMREIQTIITVRCYFLRADENKKVYIKQWQSCGATEPPRCCAGSEMVPPLWTTVCISLPHKLSHFTPRCLPKRHANRRPQHHLDKNTPHRTFTHNSQSCKRTQISFKRRILSILPQHSCHVFIKWSTTQQRKGTTDWYTQRRSILKHWAEWEKTTPRSHTVQIRYLYLIWKQVK